MKKLLVLVMVAFMVFAMFACAAEQESTEPQGDSEATTEETTEETSEAEEPSGEGEICKVAFVFDILDVNQTDHANHIRYQLELINEEQDVVTFTDFTGYNCNMDNDEFINNMETAVVSGYNIIFAMPVDNSGCLAAYSQAAAEGVTVIDLRGAAETTDAIRYMGIGEEQIANCTKEYMQQYLDDNPDVVLNTCLVYPTAGHTGSYCRLDVIKELADENPGRVNILVEGYGDWATDPTQKLVEDWIQTYDDINYIQCANDEEALGAINALEAAGIKDEVMVLGGNGGAQGAELIVEGRLDATAAQEKPIFARNIAEMCVALYDGTFDSFDGYDPETMQVIPDINACYMLTPDNAQQRLDDLEFYTEVFKAYE